jgi:hypothetical protein
LTPSDQHGRGAVVAGPSPRRRQPILNEKIAGSQSCPRLEKFSFPPASIFSCRLLKFFRFSTHSSIPSLLSPHSSPDFALSSYHLHTTTHTLHIMSAARMFAPKVASIMGSTSAKVARPVVRSSIKSTSSQRAFSGKLKVNWMPLRAHPSSNGLATVSIASPRTNC